jgi:asparagine synthase (glutamine-hydrolysing)
LLGGYPKHSAERFAAIYHRLFPAWAHDGLAAPLINALPYRFRRIKILAASIALRDPVERMARWMGALTYAERDQLLAGVRERRPVDPEPFRVDGRRSALARVLYFDQMSWLPDNLLERGDRITMAASIEARMPFMDTELARLMARLPDRWRIRGLTQKFILRQAMRDILPPAILARPKVGFRVPINEWFRGSMRGFVRDLIDAPGSLARTLCDRGVIDRTLTEHESGRQNHEKLIWIMVNLELFQRRFRLSY